MGELFPVKYFKFGKAYLPTLRQWGHSLTTCNIFKGHYILNTHPGNQNYLHKYLRYTSCTISGLSQDYLDCFFPEYLSNQISDFQIIFFLLWTEIQEYIFNTVPFLCDQRGWAICKTKWGSGTDQFVFILSHSVLKNPLTLPQLG